METKVTNVSREELFKLYETVIAEYRFQVTFNWDRTRQVLLLNVGILSAGTGLLNLAKTDFNLLILTGSLFLSGIFINVLGIGAVRTGKKYYRQIIRKKAMIEEMLSLPYQRIRTIAAENRVSLSLDSTDGMKRTNELATDKRDPFRTTIGRYTVTRRIVSIFWLFIMNYVTGIGFIIITLLRS